MKKALIVALLVALLVVPSQAENQYAVWTPAGTIAVLPADWWPSKYARWWWLQYYLGTVPTPPPDDIVAWIYYDQSQGGSSSEPVFCPTCTEWIDWGQ